MNNDVLLLVKKLALLNAVKHDGKAVPGGVVGGVLGSFPDQKSNMKELSTEITKIIKEVNSLSIEAQKVELLKINPDALESKHKEHDLFAFLDIKEGEKIRTAFPPGPEKYPHIGHAKSLFLNYLLAQKYNGEFFLRFEDTNPELVKEEFYTIMLENFKWLGVSWDKLLYASDYMTLYYKHCEELLNKDKAYVCTCNSEAIKLGREKGTPCKCRSRSIKDNVGLWKKMPEMNQGDAIVRLKIDLKHKNSTMRDPAIFRIIKTTHARLGTKYSVWPNYDFQNSIMDGYFKITHRLRSKEFEMRNELQRFIQTLLGYSETKIYEFARFNLEGVESSGRVIREKVNSGELLGWDDPSLTTIVALRRRGFQPEAIKEFVVKTGITKSESTLTWDDLMLHNKRIVDRLAKRFFFVSDPIKIKVKGAPKKIVELKFHPDDTKKTRILNTHEDFFISKKDLDSLKKGNVYRLIECLNFIYEGNSKFTFVDESVETYKTKGKGMLHYLPVSDSLINMSVLMPDKTKLVGITEPNISIIKEGDVVQFERVGFARLDNKTNFEFWYTH